MHDFLRDLFLDNAPSKVLRSVLAGSALLALVGVAGPQQRVTAELTAAAMHKAHQVQRVMVGVMQGWLEQRAPIPARPRPTPTPTR